MATPKDKPKHTGHPFPPKNTPHPAGGKQEKMGTKNDNKSAGPHDGTQQPPWQKGKK